MVALGTQLQPVSQRRQRTFAERDKARLVSLPVLDPERALAQVHVAQSQPEEFGATQAGEDQHREHGGVAEGAQHGGLLTGCLQKGLGLFGAEAHGQRLCALRHADPHEGIAFGDTRVADVSPEGAQARYPTAHRRGTETALAQPGDVRADGGPVHSLHGGLATGLAEALHELTEVGLVGDEGLRAAVEFQVKVGYELVEDGGKLHGGHPPSGGAAHGSSEAVPVRSVRGENGTCNSATRPTSRLRGLEAPESGTVTSGEWAYKPNSVSRRSRMAAIRLIPPRRDRSRRSGILRSTRWRGGPPHCHPIRACSGRGLPSRLVAGPLVRSYRTISPLPGRISACASGVVRLTPPAFAQEAEQLPPAVCFCGTFRRVTPPGC